MVSIPFCGQSYADKTLPANAQRSVNLYPFRSPVSGFPGQDQRIVMYPTPGYETWLDSNDLGIAGAGAIRGWFEINDVLYWVSGSKLIKTEGSAPNFTHDEVGELQTSAGRVTIACNTVELAISDGLYGYVYHLQNETFQIIIGGSFPPAGGVTNFTFQDGYTLAGVNGSKQFIQSDLLAAGTYGDQAFAEVTSFPDDLVAVFSDQLQTYIFGPKVTEVRFNASSVPLAFQKVVGVLIQAGCASLHTIVKVGSSIIWLATDAAGQPYVATLQGYNPKPISTPPINEVIERYSAEDIAQAFAYTYREGDNQFYSLTFPQATWVYDVKMNMWHERSIDGGRDLPDHYITFQGKHVVGDSTGKLYYMSQDYSTDHNGNGLKRIRTCQHFAADGVTMFLNELRIDIESGVGTLSGQGSDPLATLKVSKDGGRTWINVGTAALGKIGEYRKRLLWRRLGRFRDKLTLELTITDPVRTYILGAYANVTKGTK